MSGIQNSARSLAAAEFESSRHDKRDLLVNSIRVNELVDLLEGELGYACLLSAEVVGMSGATHRFDIVAEKGTERIVIDLIPFRTSLLDSFVAEEELSEQIELAALRMRAKSYDCGSHTSAIIRLSSYLSTESSFKNENHFLEFADRFNVYLVEAPDIETAASKFKQLLVCLETA